MLGRPVQSGEEVALADARSGTPDTGDVLSDVLHSVRLTGSMFFLVEATTPWITRAPAASGFAAAVLPRSQHLVSYHVLVEGACWGGLEGESPQRMHAGDILVIAHGDPYYLAEPRDTPAGCGDDEAVSFFRRMAAGELPPIVFENGGGPDRSRFICGFLGCDSHPFNPILAALPRVIVLRGDGMRALIDFAVAELRARRAGSREVLLRLSELMFVATVRCSLDSPAAHGWLAGLRDPIVARALARLHGDPARAWTLERLAAEVGASRSVLAERFVHFVGQPPMHYLTAWRMQQAAQRLADPGAKVKTVAAAVGYESEAAFSRAFKKFVGASPLAWRANGNSSPSAASDGSDRHVPGSRCGVSCTSASRMRDSYFRRKP